MPDTPIALLAAYLWDLRAQCERQLRCLASAQQVIDRHRERADPVPRRELAGELRKYITEVEHLNATIGRTTADVLRELDGLEQAAADER